MIDGNFGDNYELWFEIELITAEELEISVDAMLDTGFSGWLTIDKQDMEGLDWTFLGKRKMVMAKGEAKFDIYAGKVRIDGQEFDIPVHAGKGVSEVLIGRQWL